MLIRLLWLLTTVLIINYAMSCKVFGGTKQKNLERKSIRASSPLTHISHLNQMEIVDRPLKLDTARLHRNPKLKILLPLYIYPNWYNKDKYVWQQVMAAAKKVSIVAIINPNNGPNNAPPNADYQQGIEDLHQAGVKLIGYVPSNYAKREIQTVKADIDLYIKHFKIDGIFIDEAANTQDKLNYYQQLYQYIKSKSKSYYTIVNPGTDTDESYISQPVADVTVTFENYQKVWNNYHPPAYTKNYSPQHFAALVHTTANRKLMKIALDRAVKYNFGYVYITNDSTDSVNRNPWDSLPEYWQAQVNYIQKINTDR